MGKIQERGGKITYDYYTSLSSIVLRTGTCHLNTARRETFLQINSPRHYKEKRSGGSVI